LRPEYHILYFTHANARGLATYNAGHS